MRSPLRERSLLPTGVASTRAAAQNGAPVDHIIQIAPGALETGTTAFSVAAPGPILGNSAYSLQAREMSLAACGISCLPNGMLDAARLT